MADTKLSALTELAVAPDTTDELYIRDVSEAASAESKRIKVSKLLPITALNIATENELVTVGNITTELDAEANLTFDGTNLTLGTGNLIVASGQGIDFSATSDAAGQTSELLDDYEEGTFTPEVADDDNNGSTENQTYGTRAGHYTKVGNRVTFTLRIPMTSIGDLTPGQRVKILGLPFAPNASIDAAAVHVGLATGLAITAGTNVSGYIAGTNTRIAMEVWDVATGTSNLLVSELSGDGNLTVAGHYHV